MAPSFEKNFVEIEPGRRLHVLLDGPQDAPLVLYDTGAFGIYADGWWVKEALKADTRVCLYDRAGLGASDPVPAGILPTPAFHVEDMRRLVRAIGHQGPFLLIGHSMSGLRMHSFAHLYPDELLGLIFVDALSPRGMDTNLNRFAHQQFGNLLKLGAYGAEKGLTNKIGRFIPNGFKLDGQPREDKVLSYMAHSHHAGSKNEVLAIDLAADYLAADGIHQLPMAVFASTYINGMQEADVEKAQKQAGYGWYGKFPREDHVSILRGVYADAIAQRAREIIALPPAIVAGRAAAL
ncbi:MAG: alpha/beta fold hydrolase [Parvularcula sp.]